jgi:hypothetical protein
MRKIVDWSGETPLYLMGGRLRNFFLITVRFGKLLELQDIQNNSFFSLGVRKRMVGDALTRSICD